MKHHCQELVVCVAVLLSAALAKGSTTTFALVTCDAITASYTNQNGKEVSCMLINTETANAKASVSLTGLSVTANVGFSRLASVAAEAQANLTDQVVLVGYTPGNNLFVDIAWGIERGISGSGFPLGTFLAFNFAGDQFDFDTENPAGNAELALGTSVPTLTGLELSAMVQANADEAESVGFTITGLSQETANGSVSPVTLALMSTPEPSSLFLFLFGAALFGLCIAVPTVQFAQLSKAKKRRRARRDSQSLEAR